MRAGHFAAEALFGSLSRAVLDNTAVTQVNKVIDVIGFGRNKVSISRDAGVSPAILNMAWARLPCCLRKRHRIGFGRCHLDRIFENRFAHDSFSARGAPLLRGEIVSVFSLGANLLLENGALISLLRSGAPLHPWALEIVAPAIENPWDDLRPGCVCEFDGRVLRLGRIEIRADEIQVANLTLHGSRLPGIPEDFAERLASTRAVLDNTAGNQVEKAIDVIGFGRNAASISRDAGILPAIVLENKAETPRRLCKRHRIGLGRHQSDGILKNRSSSRHDASAMQRESPSQEDSASQISKEIIDRTLQQIQRQFLESPDPSHLVKMIGLGPGLTPSGDDILVGLLAAWDCFASASQASADSQTSAASQASSLRASLIAHLPAQLFNLTPRLSAQMLRAAADGHYPEPLVELARQFTAPIYNAEAAQHKLNSLLSIGAHSGQDFAEGFRLGLLTAAPSLPKLSAPKPSAIMRT